MNDAPYYLAIDQGGGSSRAVVFDNAANIIVNAKRLVEVEHPRLGWVEQGAEMLVKSVQQVVADVAEKLGPDVARLAAAGLATQRSNVVCWDRDNGVALSPAISWQDRRAYQWMDNFQAQNSLIRAKTGLLVSAHYGVSKIKWCMDNLRSVQQARQHNALVCGPLASFLQYHLVTQPQSLVDPANACRTLLWNIDTKDWDDELLSLFGIDKACLPRCVETQGSYGDISVGGYTVPLTVVTGDQSAALYAYGKPAPETVYINMGTGVFIQRPTQNVKVDIPGLLCSVVYQNRQYSEYVIECTVNGAANALMEVEDALGISGSEAETNLSAWMDQYPNPPLFLNGVAGLAAPYWIADFKSRFVGDGNAREKIIAVAESILFLTKVNIQLLEEQYRPLEKVIVTGGLSNSDTLCQMLANLIKIPVYRPRDGEATARGVACLAAGLPASWAEQKEGEWFHVRQQPPLMARFERWNQEMQKAVAHYRTKPNTSNSI